MQYTKILSLILVLLFCFTGCSGPTQEQIGKQYDVNMRMKLEDVVVPKTTGVYKFTQGFDDDVDMVGLAKLIYGENADIQRSENAQGIYYRGSTLDGILRATFSSDGFPYYIDGKQTAPLSVARNITFSRNVDWRLGTEYNDDPLGNFHLFSFSAEHGCIGQALAESGAGDPKMETALAQSKAIMDFMQYDDYKQVFAGKYSKESANELWTMMGAYGKAPSTYVTDEKTGELIEIPSDRNPLPDSELYYIQYNIIPDTLPDGVDTSDMEYFLKVCFLYDKDGLVVCTFYPPIRFEPIRTETPCTAQEALEASLQGAKWLDATQDPTLWSMKYTLKKVDTTRYMGVYELHYTQDITARLEQKELDVILAAGAKGKLRRTSRYVNPLDKIAFDNTYGGFEHQPVLIHKYNTPELFTGQKG